MRTTNTKRCHGFATSVSALVLSAAIGTACGAAAAQGTTVRDDQGFTADDVARFTVGDFRAGAYFGGGYFGGAKYNVAGFATENPPGTLINPALQLEVSAEGRVYYGGFDITNEPVVQEWLQQSGGAQAGFYRNFLGVTVEIDRNTMEGRARFAGNFQNFGVPGLGDEFGFFVNSPADVVQTGHVDYERMGAKLETRLGSYYVVEDPFLSNRKIGVSWAGIIGVHLGDSTTRITNNVSAVYPALRPNGNLSASYRTHVSETAATPYVGLELKKHVPLQSGAVLNAGIAVRGGVSLIDWSANDMLTATGLGGTINRNNQAALSGTDSQVYGSISGQLGIEWGGGWSAQIGGAVQHGLVRSPNIHRPDSVEVSPGVFQLADPQVTFDPQTTWTGTIGITRRF